MQELKAVVFQKKDLDFQATSEVKLLLPLLAYQDSNSDVDIKFEDILKTNSPLHVLNSPD